MHIAGEDSGHSIVGYDISMEEGRSFIVCCVKKLLQGRKIVHLWFDGLLQGRKNVPHGLAGLLGDLFRECGVEVVYSDKDDNDDTLAWHAHADGADVLSDDKDFFRWV
jgi:hypothetical protein